MRTMSVSQVNAILSNYKMPNKHVVKQVHQTFSKPSVRYLAPSLAMVTFGIPSAVTLYCGDEEDNFGYGDPDWMVRQREQNDEASRRSYYGYDTPGLGSGSREVDWDN